MPLGDKAKKMMSNMKDQYGNKKGEEVFYAMENKGKVPGMAKGGMTKGYNKGGMAKKQGYARGGTVKKGNTDRRGKGMFYDSESPRGYK